LETILFYTPGTCALAGIIALEWLGEPYKLCRVEREERGGEVYRRINPRGQVPALRVGARTLVEGNAILTHIATRRPEARLLPTQGTWERDVANQWLAYFASGFHAAFWPYFSPQRYAKDAEHHDAVRAAAVDGIRRELGFVNAHLAGKDFVLGSERTLLDGYLQAMDRWANALVDMAKDFPNVWRHQKTMAKEPAVRFGTAIERGDEPLPPSASFAGHVPLAHMAA
jgi:glutathione S-transferase